MRVLIKSVACQKRSGTKRRWSSLLFRQWTWITHIGCYGTSKFSLVPAAKAAYPLAELRAPLSHTL